MDSKGGKDTVSEEVKENDVIKRISPTGTECIARVRWVNEKGEAGVTYLAPEKWEGSAQVVGVEELEVMEEGLGDLTNTSTEELITAITRLRGMRLPKKLSARKPSTRKKSIKSKLDTLFEEGGSELDSLIQKAIRELKEEGGDK